MSSYIIVQILIDGLSIAFGLVALFVILKKRIAPHNAVTFFCVWAGIYLFEFYFLGENSYIHMDEEGDHYIPFFKYLLTQHLGGAFGHHVGGGIDVYANVIPSIQLISPELILLDLFPVWIAYLIHLFIMLSLGFWGAYLMASRHEGCSEKAKLAIASFFTVSTYSFLQASYPLGAGFAVIPIAIYALVYRTGVRAYYPVGIATAMLVAVYVIPTWNVQALYAAIILTAYMLRKLSIHLVIMLAIMTLFLLVNWAEPLFAIAQFAALTDRGTQVTTFEFTLDDFLSLVPALISTWTGAAVVLLGFFLVAIHWTLNDPLKVRATIAFAILNIGYLVFLYFPWHKIGLGPLSSLSHSYMLIAAAGMIIPLLANAADRVRLIGDYGHRLGSRIGPAMLLALSCAALFNFKAHSLGAFLYHGGQSHYHGIETLARDDWRPNEPFRVLTMRVRDIGPEPAIPYGLYGLESFDAFMNIRPTEWAKFYNIGVLNKSHEGQGVDTRVFVDWSRWKDGEYHNISQQLSLPMLGLANVRFILSPLPIADDALRFIAGPSHPPVTRDLISRDIKAYAWDRVRRWVKPNDMYVYELPWSYPEVFSTHHVATLSDEATSEHIIKTTRTIASEHGYPVVSTPKHAAILGAPEPTLIVETANRVVDGYEITVDAPDGGIVVVNTYALPFWAASVDGTPTTIVPVNQVQMAVSVPAGSRTITFAYSRPTVRSTMAKLFH